MPEPGAEIEGSRRTELLKREIGEVREGLIVLCRKPVEIDLVPPTLNALESILEDEGVRVVNLAVSRASGKTSETEREELENSLEEGNLIFGFYFQRGGQYGEGEVRHLVRLRPFETSQGEKKLRTERLDGTTQTGLTRTESIDSQITGGKYLSGGQSKSETSFQSYSVNDLWVEDNPLRAIIIVPREKVIDFNEARKSAAMAHLKAVEDSQKKPLSWEWTELKNFSNGFNLEEFTEDGGVIIFGDDPRPDKEEMENKKALQWLGVKTKYSGGQRKTVTSLVKGSGGRDSISSVLEKKSAAFILAKPKSREAADESEGEEAKQSQSGAFETKGPAETEKRKSQKEAEEELNGFATEDPVLKEGLSDPNAAIYGTENAQIDEVRELLKKGAIAYAYFDGKLAEVTRLGEDNLDVIFFDDQGNEILKNNLSYGSISGLLVFQQEKKPSAEEKGNLEPEIVLAEEKAESVDEGFKPGKRLINEGEGFREKLEEILNNYDRVYAMLEGGIMIVGKIKGETVSVVRFEDNIREEIPLSKIRFIIYA